MKYMTPELHARINLASDDEAERAYDEWEANGVVYRARTAAIEGRLPESFRRFLKGVCLHDAELRAFDAEPRAEGTPANVVMTLRLGSRVVTLYYDLLAPPERRPVDLGLAPEQHRAVWPTAGTPEWLYDEIDVLDDSAGPPGFVHEILLSTGEVVRLTFFGFDWHVHDLNAALAAATSR